MSNKKNPFANTISYECNEKDHIASRCESKKKKNKDTYKGKKMRFKKLNQNGRRKLTLESGSLMRTAPRPT